MSSNNNNMNLKDLADQYGFNVDDVSEFEMERQFDTAIDSDTRLKIKTPLGYSYKVILKNGDWLEVYDGNHDRYLTNNPTVFTPLTKELSDIREKAKGKKK